MPRKTKNAAPADAGLPDIPKELLDQFVTGPMTEAIEAIMRKFKKAVIERAQHGQVGKASNHRNGSSGKTVLTDDGPDIEIPSDRQGPFEP